MSPIGRAKNLSTKSTPWSRIPPWVSPLVTLAIFCGAIFIIHGELAAHSLQSIARSFNALAPASVLGAAALAMLSYATLVANEFLSLRIVGKTLPLHAVWRPALTAYALGNALGLSFATAPATRARLYRPPLQPKEIAAVSVITGASVGISALFVAGLGLLVGAEEVSRHGFGDPILLRLAGAGLVTPAVGWLALAIGNARTATIAGLTVATPSFGRAALQLAIGALDWAATAGLLYLLLPEHGGWSYAPFLSVFVAAGALGAVSGSPGGLGVFEAGILALSPAAQHAPATVAALLVYRLLYTLLPLGIASILLIGDVASNAQAPAMRTARRVGSAGQELAPQAFAILSFACGFILLVSSATPGVADRLGLLGHIAPTYIVDVSHFLASVVGVLLLVVAAGLWRRSQGAYVAALALLGLGAVFALLKGLDFEEATILAFAAVVLAFSRRVFTRTSRLLNESLSVSWFAALIGAVVATGWLGFFAYRNIDYSDELWWTFLRDADASRFLRGAAGVGLLVAIVSVWSLFASSVPTPVSRRRRACAAMHASRFSATMT